MLTSKDWVPPVVEGERRAAMAIATRFCLSPGPGPDQETIALQNSAIRSSVNYPWNHTQTTKLFTNQHEDQSINKIQL